MAKLENLRSTGTFPILVYLSMKQKETMPQFKKRTVESLEFVIDNESGEEVLTHSYRSEHTEFNEKGDPILEESWGPDGVLNERYIREYDEEGRLSKLELHQEGIGIAEDRSMVYDDDGKLLKDILHYQDGSISETVYSYDSNGKRTGLICKDEDDEEEFREEIGYTDQEKKNFHKRWEFGEVMWEKRWEYNEDGFVTRAIEIDEEGQVFGKEYTLGDDGEVLEERNLRNGKLISVRKQAFDNKGNISEIISEDEGGFEKVVFAYDEQGNQVLQEAFNRAGEKLHSVERDFDEHGNIQETRVWMYDLHNGLVRRYSLRYDYEYFEA